jgi:peptidoglycan/LPS O-acetylase OafA/YrhL
MAASESSLSRRLAWLEGLRIFAAIAILIYHAQELVTNYAYTPQPSGLLDNLNSIALSNQHFGQGLFVQILGSPCWFGFQFVDVFILISGFSLMLSLKGNPLELGRFLKRRFLRILWPYWTVAWLSYPILWAIGTATSSYIPDLWHIFGGATFPLLFDYEGELLLWTSGPWWFIPLILSFALVFPVLWHLLKRWGSRNLIIVSLLLTLAYRAVAVYQFGGHPTYVMLDTPSGWLPFLPFLAKLSTFVLGMVAAQSYQQGRGPVYWTANKALPIGIVLYILGFVCQFYWAGWVVAELLTPVGLTLCAMVIFRSLEGVYRSKSIMIWLGSHSYSYFLIHNFVVDRTINLVIGDNLWRYYLLLPVMIVGTLVLAVLADATIPLVQRFVTAIGRDVDYVLTIAPTPRRRLWYPQVGDRVCYQSQGGWTVLKVEKLLDEHEFYLCQVSDGNRTMWLSEDDLELDPSDPSSLRKQTTVTSLPP